MEFLNWPTIKNVHRKDYRLCSFSLETVNFFLPLALLEAKTRRPFAEDILSLNPCLFLLFLCDGWNVRFISFYFLKQGCKYKEASFRMQFLFKISELISYAQ
jgi:hypothetical protein